MAEDLTIAIDLPCYACQYNLRGLAVEGRCPECGATILPSLRQPGALPSPGHDHIRRYLRVKYYAKAAGLAGCSVDAVMFVNDAFQTTKSLLERARSAPLGPMDHLTARQVSDGFRAHARSYFNDEAEARDLLNEWGIRSSEDVGRIVFAMVESGRLQAGPNDLPSAFAGLFTLENIFAAPELAEFMNLGGGRNRTSRAKGRKGPAQYGGITVCIGLPLFFATMFFTALHTILIMPFWIEIVISLIVGGGLFFIFIVSSKTDGSDAATKPIGDAKSERESR